MYSIPTIIFGIHLDKTMCQRLNAYVNTHVAPDVIAEKFDFDGESVCDNDLGEWGEIFDSHIYHYYHGAADEKPVFFAVDVAHSDLTCLQPIRVRDLNFPQDPTTSEREGFWKVMEDLLADFPELREFPGFRNYRDGGDMWLFETTS